METLFDIYSRKEIENKLELAKALLNKKEQDLEIIAALNCKFSEELLDIAKARARANESKFKGVNAKYLNSSDLRFSTPSPIADYRANRLKCKKIVDLCSGVGIQAYAFSKKCSNVLAIEIDERKVVYSKNSFQSDNLEFIQGDVLSNNILEKVKDFNPDIIFCDPQRLQGEKERNLDSIQPNIKEIIKIYSQITPNICIEIPPRIDWDKLLVLGDFEAEYLSFNKKLNRLNLYFNGLKKSKISVADPCGIKIISDSKAVINFSQKPLPYIYEVSLAISKAGLEKELAAKIKAFLLQTSQKNKLILTSKDICINKEAKTFTNTYRVTNISKDIGSAARFLESFNFKNVILKININPQDYWREKKKFEKNLKGKKTATIFNYGTSGFLICEEII